MTDPKPVSALGFSDGDGSCWDPLFLLFLDGDESINGWEVDNSSDVDELPSSMSWRFGWLGLHILNIDREGIMACKVYVGYEASINDMNKILGGNFVASLLGLFTFSWLFRRGSLCLWVVLQVVVDVCFIFLCVKSHAHSTRSRYLSLRYLPIYGTNYSYLVQTRQECEQAGAGSHSCAENECRCVRQHCIPRLTLADSPFCLRGCSDFQWENSRTN